MLNFAAVKPTFHLDFFFFLIFIFPKLVFEKTIFIYFVIYPKVGFLGCDVQIISKMLE